MEAGSSIGLRNAPVTKLLLGSVIVNSTLLSLLDLSDILSVTLVPQLWGESQIWRLGVWQLACGSFSELLFGSLALYNMSVVERFMGSRKFAAFVTLAYGTTSLLVPLLLGTLVRPFSTRANFLVCGITPTIFAMLFQYHVLIPPTSTFVPNSASRIGVDPQQVLDNHTSPLKIEDVCTNKLWVYAIAAQIALYRYPSSLVGAITGWAVGALYQYSWLPQNWRLPAFLTYGVHSRPIGTIMREEAPESEIRSRHAGARTVTNNTPTMRPVSASDVETLSNMMNVTREIATEALYSSGGSLERAVDHLLMQ